MASENDTHKPTAIESGSSFPFFGSPAGFPFCGFAAQAFDYWVDACQRAVLFMDILRQRGNMHFAYLEGSTPNVLHFGFEILIDGRDLLEPVNFFLMRILPPEGVATDPTKRPFIVFDPRAGQGPGIGGMKKDSEIGIAIQAGHPCYFVGFRPDPIPGQTIEDVSKAEAHFVRKVIERHPLAERPCLIGNCQAGWQIALMAAMEPELSGVLILAGAPISYWAGKKGGGPMRYTAGLTGGAWLTAFVNDLGNGRFDGAHLVSNFEMLNPANTYWKKNYNLYAKIDTEGARFLDFERWWGSPILLNASEIQYITDELFIGNHLATAKIRTNAGFRVDLRNIKSPIVVFCSHGDEITPPAQALGWILDLYRQEDEIIANEQTIIYTVHPTAGHLALFVSNAVAIKEHEKLIHNIDLIETLPPGLYEAVISDKDAATANPELASGAYVMRFEKRTLDDIRAFGANAADDDRRFAAVARLSENIEGLYNTFVSPAVKALVTEQSASALRRLHPNRLRFEMFSDKNPFLRRLAPLAEAARTNRHAAAPDNMFLCFQERISEQIVGALIAYRNARDAFVENFFMHFYGAPLIQAAVGLRTVRPYVKESAGRDLEHEREIERRLWALLRKMREGGIAEALIRAFIYVGMGGGGMDEREYTILRRLRGERDILPSMTLSKFKDVIRQQAMLLLLDTEGALESIPYLLERAEGQEQKALDAIRRVIAAHGTPTEGEIARLDRIAPLFAPKAHHPHRRATDVSSGT
jgi:hypothetical protein